MKRTLGQRTHVNCFKSSIVRRLNRDLGLIPGQEVILLRIHAHDTPLFIFNVKHDSKNRARQQGLKFSEIEKRKLKKDHLTGYRNRPL